MIVDLQCTCSPRILVVGEFISEKEINVREHNNNGAEAHYHCIALAYSMSIGFQHYLKLAERRIHVEF